MTSANSLYSPPIDGSGLAVVVVGGNRHSVETNQTPGIMVRELARRSPVLHLLSEAHGSVLRRLQGRARHLGARDVARTVLDSTHPRRVDERLWIAPVRGLSAIGPLWAPEAMRRRNVRRFAAVIRAWLNDIGARECVLVIYWWALPELVELVPNVASVYDCIDDHAALPQGLVPPATVARLENQMLDAVDQTFVVSPHLLDGREGLGRNIAVLPTAIDLRLFKRLERDGFSTPEQLRSIPHPIVGYAGGLGPRIDWELLLEVSDCRPDWSFVFLGGDAVGAPEALRGRSNVFFLKSMPYTEALGALASFDVATLPMCANPFSLGNSFLKLRDYLAHGMPVVATPLPDPVAVAETAPGLVTLAEGPDAWISAVSAGLNEPRSSPRGAARRRYAAEQSAERRATRIVSEALEAARTSVRAAERSRP
jgi:glycosyltransferase involved in cell wall biosynthesis